MFQHPPQPQLQESQPRLLVQLSEQDLSELVAKTVSNVLFQFAGRNLASTQSASQPTTTLKSKASELMTRKEVIDLFGISYPTLARWIARGILKPLHFERSVRFNKQDIDKLLSSKGVN